MLRVTDEVKALFKADNVHKDLVIEIPEINVTLTNSDIYEESMRLEEAIETSNNLTFTGCIASRFEVEIADLPQELHGKRVTVGLYLPDEEEPVPIFNGNIDTVTGTSHEEYSMKLSCYDDLYRINNTDVTAWYNSLTFPISIKNMRDSFFEYLGIEQEADYLVNDYLMVNKTIDDAAINGETIIKSICQLNGRYGRMGRNGKFQYVHLVEGTEALYPREDLFPSDDLFPSAENAVDNVNKAHYETINFENYRVTPIDKVQLISREGGIISATGTGANAFTVKDNPFVWDKTATELAPVSQNLFNEIRGLWYIPADVNCIGLPYVECGDFVMMACRRTQVRAYVLHRVLRGIQTLKDNFVATGDIKQPVYKVSIQQKINANSSAIKSESVRAQGAESNLNTGLGQANNRISQVSADLGQFKNVEAGHIQALSADIQSASVQTLNAANIYANQIGSEAKAVAKGYFDQLNASKISATQLDTKLQSAGTIGANHIKAYEDLWVSGVGDIKRAINDLLDRVARLERR